MIGIKFEGASETFPGLVQAIQGQVGRHRGCYGPWRITGELFHRDAAGGKRLLPDVPASISALDPAPVKQIGAHRIKREDVVVERELCPDIRRPAPRSIFPKTARTATSTAGCPDLQQDSGASPRRRTAAPMRTEMTPMPARYA